ncbi:MAG TPA: DNA-binding response regulator [Lachnospiraceae bacterium]|nr:DNA-binding response regulator [Lachnospiraceae bacterium]HCA70897.1 DNA-binding response regulator [Lachnospiraceae bacterium]HCM14241.1 DNA-binding response regulator [Lachnospiraceae bacterium]HCR40843.1 DNA-binding response regulator [Lachnospiraceae bacterium]
MLDNKIKILIADDDEDIREILDILLKAEGFSTVMASDGKQAIELADETIDLIILDVAMPEKNGFQACNEIRKKTIAPILFLTAKTMESDKVFGFSAGGDDYLVKPFSNTELIFRIKALLRRCYQYQPVLKEKSGIYKIDGIVLNEVTKNVTVDNVPITLTPIEFDLLKLMMKFPNKVFTGQNLYESIWNQNYTYLDNNTIVVHISNLRKKIEKDPKNPVHLKSMWGRGYYVGEANKIF